MATNIPRADTYAEVIELRKLGLTYQQVADRLGISRSWVANLIYDPDGSKVRERKDSYGGTCERCGGKTDGSNGRAKAPKLCAACYMVVNEAKHGTRSRYQAGCGCDACRAANTATKRALIGTPPPTHSQSGYSNYGCRCDICREAHRRYEWLHADERKRYPSANKKRVQA